MRYLRLGYLGYFCNGFSVLWIVVLGVCVCMPPSIPVSVGSMNYTSPILVGLFGLIMLSWYFGNKKFQGPKIDWDAMDNLAHVVRRLSVPDTGRKDSTSSQNNE